ncbi:uncharacterized protein N7484_003412 [Penicillium longicatenatum]|uniref:uncharacterized protein n=1 Tax=Penicillium longicatenatum TaxID=1561947 RepID=UPI00254940E0|nr:uncharacterized protein N7484_003412 [Penicillium longicatenatum]KAJ5649689.1 hypothetical protein N7484_003412 [Penicillium longicatenatum]
MPSDRDSDNKRDKSNMPHNKDWDGESETNPFVTFRRFADEQVSSVLQSITGLPSSVGSPQSDSWTIFTDDKSYKNMAYRHRNGANSNSNSNSNVNHTVERDSTPNQNPDPNTPDGEEKPPNYKNNNQQLSRFPQQSSYSSEEVSRSAHFPSRNDGPSDFFGLDSFFKRFEDHYLPFASFLFHPHINFPFSDMFDDSNLPTWPLTYIMLSPYSPLHLERQAQYRAQGDQGVFSAIMSSLRPDSDSESDRDPAEPQWREAFEDLLRLENGKSMLERDSLAPSKTRPENGTEWLHGLVKRGSLGDRWKYISGTDGHPWSGITFTGHSENDRSLRENDLAAREEAQAESELALYERFLQDIQDREREFSQASPLFRALLEERRHQQDKFEKFQRGMMPDPDQGNDDTESWLDLVSGGHRKSVPETEDTASTPAADTKQVESAAEPRVISTMTRTERKRLPDGSIETKKVQTKRYEDGREESESFVEMSRPKLEAGEEQPEQNMQPKNGWFWKD